MASGQGAAFLEINVKDCTSTTEIGPQR